MPDIVGVRFKRAGKVYYFDPVGTDLKINDYVVVQTARGTEMGQVTISPKQVQASEITAELKPIVRKAGPEDIKRAQDFTAKENYALVECNKIIARLALHMKLISAEYNLDGSRLTFFFTAEERVDFRELVRQLTAFFKTRIELRQIGPRDQAKLVGGLGRCGRGLCCAGHLSEFTPVSIRMAKEQDLPLDPMKISGVCGRLQCCLAYENTQYHEAKALLPRRGLTVETPEGIGIVIGGNPMKETVLVEKEDKTEAEFPLAQVKIVTPPPKAPAVAPPAVPAGPVAVAVAAPMTAEVQKAPARTPEPAKTVEPAVAAEAAPAAPQGLQSEPPTAPVEPEVPAGEPAQPSDSTPPV